MKINKTILLPLLSSILLLSSNSYAKNKNDTESQIKRINPPELFQSSSFSHAVINSSKKLIFISGQVGEDKSGDLVGKGNFLEQLKKSFENIDIILKSSGSDRNHVLKINYSVVGMNAEKFKELNDFRKEFFEKGFAPASAVIGVESLYDKDCLVEIEVIAEVPDKLAQKIKKKSS